MIINNELKVFKISKKVVIEQLEKFEFDKKDDNFNYLTKLPVDVFSKEVISQLETELGSKRMELETLNSKLIEQLWIDDLENLKELI